jgi:hypothetical protein
MELLTSKRILVQIVRTYPLKSGRRQRLTQVVASVVIYGEVSVLPSHDFQLNYVAVFLALKSTVNAI